MQMINVLQAMILTDTKLIVGGFTAKLPEKSVVALELE